MSNLAEHRYPSPLRRTVSAAAALTALPLSPLMAASTPLVTVKVPVWVRITIL